jgi:uncharacterized membrane protein YphA (DoxX/SURF4 family)
MKHTGAISIAPFILRIVVGIVFVWAGLGKVLDTFEVKGEQAARLANMGVYIDRSAPKPSPAPKPGASREGSIHLVRNAPASGQSFTAEDFPEPVKVAVVNRLALELDKMANASDPRDSSGNPTIRLWPKALGQGVWPLAAAWACAIAEIGCGTFLLVGFLARFCSFVLFFNMLVAVWLTTVGPAIQAGNARLGFLPNHPTFGNGGEWMVFLVQFILIGALAALLFSGAGGLSVDRALFGGPTGSRPAPPAAKSKEE